jgi:SAM-dependent methyltransferase
VSVVLRARDGTATSLPVDDWCAPATPAELDVLAGVRGPVLDLGCGPGRLVVALAAMGVPALGIDVSAHAVARAVASGAPVLRRSIFDQLPGERRWRTALLFDGNIGIGGDPVRLLRRVAHLLGRHGRVIIEVGAPGGRTLVASARLERGDETTAWFPWAWVGGDALPWFAARAALNAVDSYQIVDRWFTVLERAW